jgi:hypothetical protein
LQNLAAILALGLHAPAWLAERRISMNNAGAVVLQLEPPAGSGDEELTELTQLLRARLLDLDVGSVDPIADTSKPEGSKGLEPLIGWLAVRLGKEALRTVVGAVVEWATRTSHVVEVSYGGDVLKVTGVTSAQQERVINDFLARHSPSP